MTGPPSEQKGVRGNCPHPLPSKRESWKRTSTPLMGQTGVLEIANAPIRARAVVEDLKAKSAEQDSARRAQAQVGLPLRREVFRRPLRARGRHLWRQ